MAKLVMKFEVLLPKDKDWPQSKFKQWDLLTTAYMTGPMRSFLLDDFKDTTKGWTHKPSFNATYNTPYNTRKQLMVFPVGRYTLNWSRVSEGTRPRTISSKPGGPAMVFPRYYSPYTQPGGRYGGSGTRHGPIVRTRLVGTGKLHEITPRKFSQEIAKKDEKRIFNDFHKIAMKVFFNK
jgi:hypothetical protein